VDGRSSRWFEPIVSFPFTPGHEIVGDTGDGRRVVVEPVLGCAVRGIDPPCEACATGQVGCCTRTAHGLLSPGLQTGYCEDTGGGWGTLLVAHRSQIHTVPEELSDEAAVLIEPFACAVHAVLRANITDGATVLVSGAGTMGLLTIAAVTHLAKPGRVIAMAKHPRQRDEARRLGADDVVAPDAMLRSVRLATRSFLNEPEQGKAWLAGGVDTSFECSGSAGALEQCLRTTRPRGRVVLVGLPGPARIDLAPVWHRELHVMGAYTYGVEPGGRHTFDIAIELAQRVDVAPLVSARYPLTRYDEAIDHAMDSGRLGAVKVVFDMGDGHAAR
jgi:threonine dehydrogenase-like Zn-dependent dehydrogenase